MRAESPLGHAARHSADVGLFFLLPHFPLLDSVVCPSAPHPPFYCHEQTMFLCVEDVPCVEDKVVFVPKVTCLLCEWWSEGKCHQWRNKHNG